MELSVQCDCLPLNVSCFCVLSLNFMSTCLRCACFCPITNGNILKGEKNWLFSFSTLDLTNNKIKMPILVLVIIPRDQHVQ